MATDAGVDGVECDGHSAVQGVDMSDCQRCKVLEARVVDLQAQVKALRRMLDDLTGMPMKSAEMYEDEAPLVHHMGDDK